MGTPTTQEMEEALAEAARMREKDEDARHVAKALLSLNYRVHLLERVESAAKHFLHSGLAPHEHTELVKAIEAADRAVRLVHDHATALAAIGAAYSMTTTDQERAGGFIERALAIDPNNAWAWMRAGWLKTIHNQIDGALESFERALALSPYDPFAFNMYFGMAAAHGDRHEFLRAAELVEKGLRAGPGVTWAYRMLASYLAQAGETEKAAAAIAEFKRNNPGVTIEKLREGMPPSMLLSNPQYLEGMRKAGIPER